ncbi:hypothetical protein JOB18_001680 [Solea senegalensis]|uniref:Uncharacterized protein n=1 Tax=Solea senegalensis TaxID=28829 RepID=A0AAV6S143_SOLSE|nr:hypothetical protein JOB18_001680 [Solea senegalensis]
MLSLWSAVAESLFVIGHTSVIRANSRGSLVSPADHNGRWNKDTKVINGNIIWNLEVIMIIMTDRNQSSWLKEAQDVSKRRTRRGPGNDVNAESQRVASTYNQTSMPSPHDIDHDNQAKLLMKEPAVNCSTNPPPTDLQHPLEDNLFLSLHPPVSHP